MSHPMHLHGHSFQVIGINGKSLNGALRDTVLVPPKSSVTVAFDANNPGIWYLHCHILWHLAAGMATLVQYEA
jgi:FtsP/CotA-like multicopper oxidase with cupredoxin domain